MKRFSHRRTLILLIAGVWVMGPGLAAEPKRPARPEDFPCEQHPIKERAHQIDLMTRVLDWFDRHLKS